MGTYTDANAVARLLQTDSFGVSTTPTETQVEAIINRKEDRIDQKLKHAWRTKTVTDLFLDYSYIDVRNGFRFDLPNYSIISITKLEVWDGNEYVDFVVDKTEGRDDDYWVDKKLGVLYVKNGFRSRLNKPIRITYTYGESTVAGEIEDLCTYMAAKDVLMMFERNIRFADDGGSNSSTRDRRVEYMEAEIKDLWNSLSNISSV